MNHSRLLPIVLLQTAILSSALSAQAASSKSWFLVAGEQMPGGRTLSTTYVLAGGIGPFGGVPTKSSNFRLTTGFVATLDRVPGGQPWLTSAQPRHVLPKAGTTMTLTGSHLHLGVGPVVTIGGKNATISSRTPDRITVSLPGQPVPGWQEVALTTASGRSSLPKSVGVLPMLDTDRGPAPDKAFDLVVRGTQGDLVILAAGAAPIALISIPGIRYGLGLHPAATVVLTSFKIFTPSGVSAVPIPAAPWASPIYVQAIVSTGNPTYGPVSFTNVLAF